MVSLDREFNVITEFKNELKPEDIKIFLYSMPIKDMKDTVKIMPLCRN